MFPTQGNTQIYSPFGSYVVEQHGREHGQACDVGRREAAGHEETGFEVVQNATPRATGTSLSSAQARIGRYLQRYYQLACGAPTPARLEMLVKELEHRAEAGLRRAA